MDEITKLLEKETGNRYVALAKKLDITETYVRMLEMDKAKPGRRLKRDIDALLKKVTK